MNRLNCMLIVLVFCLSGCGSSSTSTPPGYSGGPPGGGPPGNAPTVSVPPGGFKAGTLVAVPPEYWGEPNSLGGNKNFTIETDAGSVYLTIFNPSVAASEQVARFQRMIEPASAVSTDTIEVAGTSVSRVQGKGTRLTFNDNELTDVARKLPGEGVIGIVFGQGPTDLAIMVDGKTEAIEAFGPELEAWVKTFK